MDDILVHNMQPNYSFLFMPKVVHISWRHVYKLRFLNAINTDFKLYINKVSATVHNKLPQHLKVCNIAQHLKESTWTNIEMMSFVPEKFLGRTNSCPQIHTSKDNFPFITWLELHSAEHKYQWTKSKLRLLAKWVSRHPVDSHLLRKIILFFISCLINCSFEQNLLHMLDTQLSNSKQNISFANGTLSCLRFMYNICTSKVHTTIVSIMYNTTMLKTLFISDWEIKFMPFL